jgi:penicillin-binding protein 2
MALDDRDSDRYKLFSRRAFVLGAAQFAVFGVLAGRMYQLQVLEADSYSILAEENRINFRLKAPLRGQVMDRFGTPLATNRQDFRIVLVAEQAEDPEATLQALGRIVEIPEHEHKRILKEIKRHKSFVPVPISNNLTWEQFAAINLRGPELAGVQPEMGDTRHYPFGEQLAHVVGYVGAVSPDDLEDDLVLQLPGFRIGKSGIERSYDKILRGRAGNSQVEVNAYGRVIRQLAEKPGKPGDEVVLTLDMELQRFVCERLRGQSAAVVVMDVQNGEVLALASTPGFDPNAFNVGLSPKQWKALVENEYHPLINKAIAGQYPPGSTFKMIIAASALQHGEIDPDRHVICSGRYRLGNHDFHCWKRGGHGAMNMRNAIKHSCDTYFYDVARRLGVNRFAETAKLFGLGQILDLELPGEKAGLVPTTEWKLATMGSAWQQGETLVSGIGQGYVLATPLQLAVMTARLANGQKAVMPRLVRMTGARPVKRDAFKPLGVAQEIVQFLQDGMNAVTNEPGGTAYGRRIAEVGMEMAGKTGTSQVRRITRSERASGIMRNEDLPWNFRDHALFVAFAPVGAPRYAISVVVEHGGSGSGAAAPIARDILLVTQQRAPVQRTPYDPNMFDRMAREPAMPAPAAKG